MPAVRRHRWRNSWPQFLHRSVSLGSLSWVVPHWVVPRPIDLIDIMDAGLAVIGGRLIASKISEKTVSYIGGALFMIFAIHSFVVGPE